MWCFIGDCYDGGRVEVKEWAYQEAGKIDPRLEEGVERSVGQT